VLFQMIQKRENGGSINIRQPQCRRFDAEASTEKLEQEAKAVPHARQRLRAHLLVPRQVLGEEGLQVRPERKCCGFHRSSPGTA
jgi:hypothetical protein